MTDKQAQFTPGSWWINDDHFIAAGHGDSYKTIADPRCSDSDPQELDANAHLIAAAPDMYEALEDAIASIKMMKVDECSLDGMTLERLVERFQDELDKARGES